MNKRVTNSRAFRQSRAFGYLETQDRYLTQAPDTNLAYGYIGCGMMGLEHMRNTLLAGTARVHGVYDPAPQSVSHALRSLGAQLGDQTPTVYDSLEAACADPATDALIIATPNFTHLDVLRVAVQSNKAIFLEKPIATSVTDAYAVATIAAAHSKPVRFGLQYRYKAIYAEAIAEVAERRSVGEVHSVSMLEHRFPFLDKVGQWNKFNENTGGVLVEKCCHYFDLLNLFAGAAPERVYAIGSQAVNFKDFAYEGRQADGLDQAHVTISYANDVQGSFSLCMFVPGSREELTVCGDAGRLHATETSQLGEPNQNRLTLWRGENAASRESTPTYPAYIANAGHHGSTFFEHLSFAQQVAECTHDGPTLADGFWSVLVGAAAQQSIETGEAVTVADLLPEDFDAAKLTPTW